VIKNKSLIIIYAEITLQSNSLQVDSDPYDLIRLMIEITIQQELETEPTLLLHLLPAVLTSDATE